MKRNVLLLSLGMFALVPMQADFKPVSIEVTEEPAMPAVLRMQGLRDGQVTLALDVAADGRLTDCLVTAASHNELIRPCLEAARRWRFKPARFDGEPTPARIQIVINLSQKGAVVSRTASEMLVEFMDHLVGRSFDYELCPPDQVDGPLVAINQVRPAYARDAEQHGVGGRVRVYFYVDEEGNVRLPAAPADTHPYLSFVAVEAMRGWKFEPATRRGRPVLVAAVQEFDFGGVR